MRAHRLSRHANTSVCTIRNLSKKARRMTSVDLFHRRRLAPHRKRTKKLKKPRGPPKASAPYHCWGLHVLLRNASSPRGRNPPNPVRRHILLLYTRVVIIFFSFKKRVSVPNLPCAHTKQQRKRPTTNLEGAS